MKRLATELSYLLNRVIFGFLFVPGILWSISELFAHYLTGKMNASVTDYYQQFYGHLDSPVTWLWLVSPYLIFLLIRPRASAKIKRSPQGLSKTAGKGDSKTANTLFDQGTRSQTENVRGQTPLQLAAMTSNMDVVRMLVDGGASIDIADPVNGFRPLHNCAANGCANVCEFLLRHGADMDAQTDQGDTALHLAAASEHIDIVALLLSFHADHSIRNNAGFTAEQLAAARDYTAIVELIQQHASSEWPYPRMINSRGG